MHKRIYRKVSYKRRRLSCCILVWITHVLFFPQARAYQIFNRRRTHRSRISVCGGSQIFNQVHTLLTREPVRLSCDALPVASAQKIKPSCKSSLKRCSFCERLFNLLELEPSFKVFKSDVVYACRRSGEVTIQYYSDQITQGYISSKSLFSPAF